MCGYTKHTSFIRQTWHNMYVWMFFYMPWFAGTSTTSTTSTPPAMNKCRAQCNCKRKRTPDEKKRKPTSSVSHRLAKRMVGTTLCTRTYVNYVDVVWEQTGVESFAAATQKRLTARHARSGNRAATKPSLDGSFRGNNESLGSFVSNHRQQITNFSDTIDPVARYANETNNNRPARQVFAANVCNPHANSNKYSPNATERMERDAHGVGIIRRCVFVR